VSVLDPGDESPGRECMSLIKTALRTSMALVVGLCIASISPLRRPIKRVIKGSVIKIRNYTRRLDEELKEKPSEVHNYDQDDFAYPWLNSLLRKLLVEDNSLRPNYTWGVLQGIYLAKTLGMDRVSVIELGVAGGNGLISLERIAEKVEELFGLGIDVYGFDTGAGLPKPWDYRDLPNLYIDTAFPADVEKLKKRLKKAQLLLGLVENTVPQFIISNPAPIAFVSFDLDYYSSTIHALKLFEAEDALLLPRIHCYFDDIMGFTFSDFTGARLAISEFNASHSMRKISPIFGLRDYLPEGHSAWWADRFYMAHIFDHTLYCKYDGLVTRPFDGSTNLKDVPKFQEKNNGK
jgi:hypothetical protein